MLDDVRNHDPRPTAEERAWMEVDPFSIARRLVAVTALAAVVAFSLGLQPVDATPQVTAAASR